jgi:putative lipoic acid-binding regulatory protein
MDNLKINYPREWEFRIIGTDEGLLKLAVSGILTNQKYDLSFSNISKGGKYISLALKTVVESEEARNNIYIALRKNAAVKSVL